MKITTDLYFAAALLALGAKLTNVDRIDPRHMKFELSKPEDTENTGYGLDFLDNMEKQWANGSLMVNALKYKDAIQRMKSVVHSQ